MARRPTALVRGLSMDEGRKPQRITRTAKDPVKLRRAIAVLMSDQGQAVRDRICLIARTPPPTGVSPRSPPGR